MLTFDHFWLFALAPLPLLAARWLPPYRGTHAAARVPFTERILKASAGLPLARTRGRRGIDWLVWLLLLVAIARPRWIEPPIDKIIPTRDLLLIVDLSSSMEAEDFTNTAGKKTDRLSAAKEVVGDFLIQRTGDRVGLVVFGNAPFLQAPFSTDLELSRVLLDETVARMAGPRTALGDAIGLGISLFEESDAPEKTIIALTDGNDTASAVPPREAAKVARDRDVTIHTIAMGDPASVGEEKLDEETLRQTAEAAGGRYYLALNRTELQEVYAELDAIETREVNTISHRPRRDLYYWPLAMALLCSLAAALPPRSALARGREARLRVDTRSAELKVVES